MNRINWVESIAEAVKGSKLTCRQVYLQLCGSRGGIQDLETAFTCETSIFVLYVFYESNRVFP